MQIVILLGLKFLSIFNPRLVELMDAEPMDTGGHIIKSTPLNVSYMRSQTGKAKNTGGRGLHFRKEDSFRCLSVEFMIIPPKRLIKYTQ